MKTSSDSGERRKPKRSAALNCLIVNQFATPGLGSLLARRYVMGSIQLLLAVVGFGLVMGWFIELTIRMYRLVADLPPAIEPFPWMGRIGALIFFFSWLLAWPTTISVLREARKAKPELPPARPLPPKIEP